MDKKLILYIVRRLLEAIPLFIGLIVAVFLLVQLAPGDPIQALVGDYPAPPEYVESLRREFGLDKPLGQQLLAYLRNVARGNLGFSFANRRPVAELVIERMGNTLILTLSAMSVSAIFGVILGVIAARWPRSAVDNLITSASLLGFSIPVFWLGQILIIIFALRFNLLPAQGMRSMGGHFSGIKGSLDVLKHLLLPMFALSMRYLGINTRMTRGSMLEVMGKDFIITARAKGAPERRVLIRHGLRNALLPVATVIGYNFGFAMAGSALVESVFAWPGMGRLMFTAIGGRDTPVILGVFLVVTATAILANLITDIVYGILDPRIRIR